MIVFHIFSLAIGCLIIHHLNETFALFKSMSLKNHQSPVLINFHFPSFPIKLLLDSKLLMDFLSFEKGWLLLMTEMLVICSFLLLFCYSRIVSSSSRCTTSDVCSKDIVASLATFHLYLDFDWIKLGSVGHTDGVHF